MDDQNFEYNPSAPPAQSSGSNFLRYLGIGCLIFIVLFGIFVWYLTYAWRGWTAHFITVTVEEVLKESKELTTEEKQQIKIAIGRVTKKFENNKLSMVEFQTLMEKFTKGPLLFLTMFRGFEIQHIEPSSLTEEEKKEATLQFDRILRGWVDKKISDSKMEELINTVPVDSQGQMKEKLTDEEVKKIVQKAKEIAEEFKIISEPFEIDIAKEINKIIDESLEKKE